MSVRMLGRGRTSDHSDTDISDQEMDTARTALSVSPYKDSGYRCDDYLVITEKF